MPYRFHGEERVLDDAARQGVPGSFVTLPEGVTHYELGGPPDAQAVVLIHGFSVPYYVWDPTFAGLTAAGLRVLRFDLFGRGYSDRPDTEYNLDLFRRQLLGLLDALALTQPVDVVGLSMGGPIAVTIADRHPERVRRLVLIDPAGMPFPTSPLKDVLRLPWLGERLFDLLFQSQMVNSQGNDFVHPERFTHYRSMYLPQTHFVGFRAAILSTLRSDVLREQSAVFYRVGEQKRPTLLFWGRLDKTIPFPVHEKVLAAMPHAEFHAIDDAGHVPHYEQPEVVNPILVEFLKRQQRPGCS